MGVTHKPRPLDTESQAPKPKRTRWGQVAPAEVDSSTTEFSDGYDDTKRKSRDSFSNNAKGDGNSQRSVFQTQSITSTPSNFVMDVTGKAAAARAAVEKAKKAVVLQKQIQEQLAAIRSGGKIPLSFITRGTNSLITAGVAAALRAMPQSKPFRFDKLGREVDAEGKVIEVKPVVLSTLKVNINKEREAKLKQVVFQSRIDRNLTNPAVNVWYDTNIAAGAKGKKKGLSFVEKGFYSKKERQMRAREEAARLGLKLLTGAAKEEQKKREAYEEAKLNRILKYRKGSAMETIDGDKSTSHLDPNTLPLGNRTYGSYEEEKDVSKETEDDDDDDNEDLGAVRRQEALHVLQRRQLGIIPDVEWWDQPLLIKLAESDRLEDEDPDFPYVISEAAITDLVEHPVPIPAVVDVTKPAPPTLHLTPKERAKLRRRKRQEKEKDKQDKIRMGLIAPPPPKVKLANLARVLGTSATAEPSKIEKQVREQVEDRLRAHEEKNEERRLDSEARRTKTIAKWTRPPSEAEVPMGGAEVCVFAVKDLSNRFHLFKVDKNAQQFHVTGAAIICPPIGNLIIVEGSHKALKGYKKLLLGRIEWNASPNALDPLQDAALAGGNSSVLPSQNESDQKVKANIALCRLLWRGVVKDRAFKQWKVYFCKSEGEVRKLLSDRHSEHYWDMLKKYRDPALDL